MTDRLRIILNYGSIAGTAAFALFLAYYFMGFNPFGNISWLSAWIPIVAIYLAVKKFRDQHNEGLLSYGIGFSTSIFIALIYSTLFAMLAYLYGIIIDGGFVTLYKNEAIESIELMQNILKMDEALASEMAQEIDKASVGTIIFGDLQSKFLGSLIIALVVAAVLRKNPPMFSEQA